MLSQSPTAHKSVHLNAEGKESAGQLDRAWCRRMPTCAKHELFGPYLGNRPCLPFVREVTAIPRSRSHLPFSLNHLLPLPLSLPSPFASFPFFPLSPASLASRDALRQTYPLRLIPVVAKASISRPTASPSDAI